MRDEQPTLPASTGRKAVSQQDILSVLSSVLQNLLFLLQSPTGSSPHLDDDWRDGVPTSIEIQSPTGSSPHLDQKWFASIGALTVGIQSPMGSSYHLDCRTSSIASEADASNPFRVPELKGNATETCGKLNNIVYGSY